MGGISIGPDDTIYVTERDGLLALNSKGTMIWKHTFDTTCSGKSCNMSYRIAPAVHSQGPVYYVDAFDRLFAISLDGREQWQFKFERPVLGTPVIDMKGSVYVGAGHELFAFNRDGVALWRLDLHEKYRNNVEPFALSITTIRSSISIGADGTL